MGRIAILILGLVAAGDARSDELEDARSHYRKATAAYALGHYDDAAREYEAAFAIRPDPAILFNAAQSYRAVGQHRRALELYQNYLRVYGTEVTNREEVQRLIVSLKEAVAAEKAIAEKPPHEPAVPQPERAKPSPAPTLPTPVAPAPARQAKHSRAWVWGVAAGAVIVAGLAVGLGVGLGLPSDPPASLGTARLP